MPVEPDTVTSLAASASVEKSCPLPGGSFVFMSMGMAVVMVVITMLVVMMLVVVVMVMAVIAAIMIMFGMIVTRMVMCFVAVAGIGAAFRIKRRFDLDHPRTQPLHHAFDDMIAPDPQSFARDLRRQMAVAEVPGNANQMLRIVTADFQQRLRCGHDLDQPAVLQHQRVAAAQRDCIFEIQQEF